MKIWVLSTCVPDDPEPCWPRVFTSVEEADNAFEQVMRGEWERAEPNDEDGNKRDFPDDPFDAHEELKDILGSSWGQWEITEHEVKVPLLATLIVMLTFWRK
ncbi:hypothetical protein [Bradyrhizobium sp. Tv2a-2]|uniref:hypothetical protein n=1 Tax=Bradyrhizobium sp. Tv2a-2 TaxID=113395 RepID=UPI000466D5B9|nr:hypothetical protein [Bradyrhizobium sp. Tv2a-2]